MLYFTNGLERVGYLGKIFEGESLHLRHKRREVIGMLLDFIFWLLVGVAVILTVRLIDWLVGRIKKGPLRPRK